MISIYKMMMMKVMEVVDKMKIQIAEESFVYEEMKMMMMKKK